MRHARRCRRGSGCRRLPRARGTRRPTVRRRAATRRRAGRRAPAPRARARLRPTPGRRATTTPGRRRAGSAVTTSASVTLASWRGAKIVAAVASSAGLEPDRAAASTWAASAKAAAIRPARFGGSRVPGRWPGTRGGCGGTGSPRPSSVSSHLGEPPEVVVAVERARRVAGADPDLEVAASRSSGPRPARASRCPNRASAVRSAGAASPSSRAREIHQADAVRGRVRELDEVTGVEPAAGEVDVAVDPVQRAADDGVAVRVLVGRPGEDVEVAIVEVRRLASEVARR